ncbi:15528_t:CDS:2 [Cetraspora pellucida]|uniref:15528_t:CDS:1 n=1 Tax=Cetraspora pellucida TaxID=1433469 RepID=A0ACA9MDA4_9GLOM|nr:15528_t:CDS:2 [Cetraspora pellucida]
MEEYLFKSSFDNEEVNSDSSQEFSVDIAAENYEETFAFDWQSLRKACELTMKTDEKTNKSPESDDEFSEGDNMTKSSEKEFEKLLSTQPEKELSSNLELIVLIEAPIDDTTSTPMDDITSL